MKKYENFCRSLANLQEIDQYEPPYSNVIMTGLVGLFEICFEQSWKTMKEILEQHGFDQSKTGSPRKILKTAYSAGMIQDEEGWITALNARNNVTHAYNESIAADIIKKTRITFLPLFKELKEELAENWL